MTESNNHKEFRLADLPAQVFYHCLPLLVTLSAIASTQDPVADGASAPMLIKTLGWGLFSVFALTVCSGLVMLLQWILSDLEASDPAEEQRRLELYTMIQEGNQRFRLADLPGTLFHFSLMPVLVLLQLIAAVEGPGAPDFQALMLKWLLYALIPVACTGAICLLQRALNGPKPPHSISEQGPGDAQAGTKKKSSEQEPDRGFTRAITTIFLSVSCFMIMGAIAKCQGTIDHGYVDIAGIRFSLWPLIALMVIGYVDLFVQIFRDFISKDKKSLNSGSKKRIEACWEEEN